MNSTVENTVASRYQQTLESIRQMLHSAPLTQKQTEKLSAAAQAIKELPSNERKYHQLGPSKIAMAWCPFVQAGKPGCEVASRVFPAKKSQPAFCNEAEVRALVPETGLVIAYRFTQSGDVLEARSGKDRAYMITPGGQLIQMQPGNFYQLVADGVKLYSASELTYKPNSKDLENVRFELNKVINERNDLQRKNDELKKALKLAHERLGNYINALRHVQILNDKIEMMTRSL